MEHEGSSGASDDRHHAACSSSTTIRRWPRWSPATWSAKGSRSTVAVDGATGLAQARSTTLPDLVVLDLMLPVLDGLEVCRRLRQAAPIPVVMLTARGEEDDRIAGLELGRRRLRDQAVLAPGAHGPGQGRAAPGQRWRERQRGQRRCGPAASSVDLVAHEARRDGALVALTSKEFDLLVHLMRHPRAGVPPRGAARGGVGMDATATPPPSPSTCVGCGRSSRTTRPTPGTS